MSPPLWLCSWVSPHWPRRSGPLIHGGEVLERRLGNRIYRLLHLKPRTESQIFPGFGITVAIRGDSAVEVPGARLQLPHRRLPRRRAVRMLDLPTRRFLTLGPDSARASHFNNGRGNWSRSA